MKHIAIFRQPFFDMVLCGEKTIESRWSKNKIVPYHRVNIGDDILLKLSGSPVTATAKVGDVKYFELTPQIAENIRLKYGKQIGIDRFENWESYTNKRYCTLIWFENVKTIKPLKVPRSNGAGWIVWK